MTYHGNFAAGVMLENYIHDNTMKFKILNLKSNIESTFSKNRSCRIVYLSLIYLVIWSKWNKKKWHNSSRLVKFSLNAISLECFRFSAYRQQIVTNCFLYVKVLEWKIYSMIIKFLEAEVDIFCKNDGKKLSFISKYRYFYVISPNLNHFNQTVSHSPSE